MADAEAAQADEQQQSLEADRHRTHWRPFRRAEHHAEVLDAKEDDTQAAFEEGVVSDIDSGAISVPAGGPVTTEEEMWVLEHPWPGHTNREAIDRERAARAAGQTEGTPPPPPPPG